MQSSVVDVPGDAGRVEVRHAGGGGGRDGGGGGRTVRPSAAGEQRHECVQGPLPEDHHSARSQSNPNVLSKIVLAVNHSSTCFVASFFLPLTLAKNRLLLLGSIVTAQDARSAGFLQTGNEVKPEDGRTDGRRTECRLATRPDPDSASQLRITGRTISGGGHFEIALCSGKITPFLSSLFSLLKCSGVAARRRTREGASSSPS